MERIRPDTCSVSRETSCSRRASVPLGARRQRKDKARRGAWQRTRSRRGTWQRKDRCGRRRRRAWRRGGHGGGRATRAAGADALGAQPRNVAAKRPLGARDVEVLEGVTEGRTSRSREHSGGGAKAPYSRAWRQGGSKAPLGARRQRKDKARRGNVAGGKVPPGDVAAEGPLRPSAPAHLEAGGMAAEGSLESLRERSAGGQ